MLQVSRRTTRQLCSGAEKYCSICTLALDPYGDLPFTSWGRWPCLRGGADLGLNSFYAVCGCGTEYRCEALPGGGVWRHA
jgi:hypothetical protein